MPRTSSARCAGSQCFSDAIQYECEYGDGWCTTHVMGGGDPPLEGGVDNRADFIPTYTVFKPNELMKKAGVVAGDAISHIDGKFPKDIEDFAEMVSSLSKGTMLRVWSDGADFDVTL
jgi:hypothetical protein